MTMQLQHYTVDEVAYGFIRVANEAMARPIRNLTTMKGYDVTKHVLSCFGGAGPQHCCAIAKSLGMRKIVVHQHSGGCSLPVLDSCPFGVLCVSVHVYMTL